ncbi:Fic family protein [Cellulomonas soli]|uniref:Fic family protein n=1 Tax=Cellulomonas soli TaxID=931535 RepID=A0A512PHY4_9CELL|nr:Fic family protein [Cellulomonas soli]NYI58799.1 Fic family protein [Cellulomonas soli]GEP70821.1 Fic family protein [Cellulomonas soli]
MTRTRDWPAHGTRVEPWRSTVRGPKEDRLVTEVSTSLPPLVATRRYALTPGTAALVEAATVEVAMLDATHGALLGSFDTFLLRTESVASSRIEQVNASMDDLAKAVAGVKAPRGAVETLAATRALRALVSSAGRTGQVSEEAILDAHRLLMADDPTDGRYAGRWRDVQNWIGGSDYSPRNAVHVPPPPDTVQAYVDDLVAFADRDDMPALVQAAILHAQFESVHPFTDGNGRIGRALIHAVLRRRRVARTGIVPIAAAMLADTQRYFDVVNGYRDGYAGEFITYLAHATLRAAEEARASVDELRTMPARWRDELGARSTATSLTLLGSLLEHPVFDAERAAAMAGAVRPSTAYDAIDRLTDAGIVREITTSKRDRVWIASDVMAEIESLNARLRENP